MSPRIGGFLQALGQFYGGMAQDRERNAQTARQGVMDQRAGQLHGAQMANYSSEAQARLDAARKAQTAERTLADNWQQAVGGDPQAQAAVVSVRPDLADRFIKPPAAKRTQYDPERGAMVDLDAGSATPVQGLPERQTPRAPVMGSPEWIEAQKKLLELKRQNPPATSGNAQEQRLFNRTQSLQGDYTKNPSVKRAYDVAGVASGIKAALAGESPVDDLSVIYETVKLFDPGSVVREGEIKLFRSAQSVPQEIRALVSRWNSGRVLLPEMRQQIAALVDRKIGEQQNAVAPVQHEFGAMARRYGVESDSAFIAPGVSTGKKGVSPDPAKLLLDLRNKRRP